MTALWHEVAGRLPGVRAASATVASVGTFLLVARNEIASWIPAATGTVAAEIPGTATALGVFALSLPAASIAIVSHGLMDAIGEDRSARSLAQSIDAAIGTRGNVIGVAAYPPSLPFYLGRTITLSTVDAEELTSNYVTRNLGEMRIWPGTTLRPADWWREEALQCRLPAVFVARSHDRAAVTSLGRQLPLLVATRKYVAFGPCGGDLLASGRATASAP